jgi:phenylacetate-CoA ligase
MNALAAGLKTLRAGDEFIRRNPLVHARALALFERLDAGDFESRKRWTEERLTRLLSRAARTPYGRRVGGDRTLASWPVLEKDPVRERPGDFLTGSTWLSSPGATSGTTGTPLRLWRSLPSVAVEQAAIDLLLRRAGADPARDRFVVLRGDDLKDPADREPPFWRLDAGGRRLVFSSNHLNAATLPHFARAFEQHQPGVLHAYPSVLESFCRLLRDAGIALRVPVTLCSSEVLSETAWPLVRSTLGTRLVDHYGLAERAALAYAFEPGHYRFLPGYAHVELHPLGEDGDAAVHELVCTGLHNELMPLPRLRTGDLARLPRGADPERVALGLELFLGITGRRGDYLVAPDGSVLMGIDHIPRGVDHVLRMQVIQEGPTHVRLLIVPAPGFGDADREAMLRRAAQKLPPPMSAKVELVTELRRNRAGKVPFVIREPAATAR